MNKEEIQKMIAEQIKSSIGSTIKESLSPIAQAISKQQTAIDELRKQPSPQKPPVQQKDFDLDTTEGIMGAMQQMVQEQMGALEEKFNSSLTSVNDQIGKSREDVFYKSMRSKFGGADVAEIVKHDGFNQFLKETKNPATSQNITSLYNDAVKKGDFGTVENIIDSFSESKFAKDVYKDVLGVNRLPITMGNFGNGSGETYDDDEELSPEEVSTYGEGKTFDDFIKSYE